VNELIVGVADCRVCSEPGQVLVTYALGSCIGLVVHDPQNGVGGLLHYMLPDSGIAPARALDNPYMFADTGIPLLLDKVCARGACRRSLVAQAIGAAQMMDPGDVFAVGKRNYQAVRRILWKAGILLQAEAVGGVQSRTVRVEIGTGRVWLQDSTGYRVLTEGMPWTGGKTWRTRY
jgi:chemotaxis protein CheD